jgi:hypothetical protein
MHASFWARPAGAWPPRARTRSCCGTWRRAGASPAAAPWRSRRTWRAVTPRPSRCMRHLTYPNLTQRSTTAGLLPASACGIFLSAVGPPRGAAGCATFARMHACASGAHPPRTPRTAPHATWSCNQGLGRAAGAMPERWQAGHVFCVRAQPPCAGALLAAACSDGALRLWDSRGGGAGRGLAAVAATRSAQGPASWGATSAKFCPNPTPIPSAESQARQHAALCMRHALHRCLAPVHANIPCMSAWLLANVGLDGENATSLREAAQMLAERPPLLIGHAVRGAGCTPQWAPAWPGTRTAGRSPRSPAMAQWLRWCALRRLAPRPPWPPCPPQVTERATAGRQEVAAAGCVTLSVALCNTRASPGLQHRLPRVLLGPPAGTHG